MLSAAYFHLEHSDDCHIECERSRNNTVSHVEIHSKGQSIYIFGTPEQLLWLASKIESHFHSIDDVVAGREVHNA
jgi:frataxin-like iron-binding protein CyaY